MAFKISKGTSPGPESPEALLRDLKTKKIAGPLADQADLWRAYQTEGLQSKDVALHLPTGGGKTLVGLVLAEWRRRCFGERVVYLCPTHQLVHQVAAQAKDKFGIPVAALVGSKRNYDRGTASSYQSGEQIAISTYSSLFNTAPFFNDPHVIVLDDAHASEHYIADMWSLEVKQGEGDVEYNALVALLRRHIPFSHYQKLVDPSEGGRDRGWVDKLPTPTLLQISEELIAICDQLFTDGENGFVWSTIRDHLLACHFYFAPGRLLIRPVLPPTSSHRPFIQARQRIYMSATLGEAGELERITGRYPIQRLAPKTGWERQTIGRRYFMMPDMSLDDGDQIILCGSLINKAGRALVLTPDERQAEKFRRIVRTDTSARLFTAKDIEQSKKEFLSSPSAVAVVANRYDGIDFPEDECRLLFVEGLPKATNLQEQFLITRLGSSDTLRVRILTRIVQAFGRCTRSDKDYSTVVLRGEELTKYIVSQENRAPLHPELQAELSFGMEQSRDNSVSGFLENFDLFLDQADDWNSANDAILEERDRSEKVLLDGAEDLTSSVQFEIKYMESIWSGDYHSALEAARNVLAKLVNPRLRGYRAFWYYLSGSAAWLATSVDNADLAAVARESFSMSLKTERSLSWLSSLTRLGLQIEEPLSGAVDADLAYNIERIEALFDRLGSLNDFKFAKFETELRDKLALNDAASFEQGHKMLGQLLGFDAGNRNDEASPDPWWRASDRFCIVFEDYTAAESDCIPAKKARQAITHPNWIRSEQIVDTDALIVPVIVSACSQVERGAVPHLEGVIVCSTERVRQVLEIGLMVIKDLRREYPGAGDLAWRALAAERLKRHQLSPHQFVEMLRASAPKLNIRGA